MKKLNYLSDTLSSLNDWHKQWQEILPKNPLLELSLNKMSIIPQSLPAFNNYLSEFADNYALANSFGKHFHQEYSKLHLIDSTSFIKNWNQVTTQLHKSITSVISSLLYKELISVNPNKILPELANTMKIFRELQVNHSFFSQIANPVIQTHFVDSVSLYTQINCQNSESEDAQSINNELYNLLDTFSTKNLETITIDKFKELNERLDKNDSMNLRFYLFSILLTILLSFYSNEIKQSITSHIFENHSDESKEFSKMLKVLCLQEE